MIKTLKNLFKQDKERFLIPNGVQDVIPIRKIYDDGEMCIRDSIYLYKGGTEGAANTGNEPYSEYYACQIADKMGIGCVPVSYTHLDVYKRQAVLCNKGYGITLAKVGGNAPKRIMPWKVSQRWDTVSYTHLDVYKRQIRRTLI